MGSYKATRNDEMPDERPKTQTEIDTENNANTLSNLADAAIASGNVYAVAAGKIYKGLEKVGLDKIVAKGVTNFNKIAPGGKQVQNLSNNLSESGIGNKIGQAAAAKSGKSNAGGKAASLKGGKSNAGGKAASLKGGTKFSKMMSGAKKSSSSDGNIAGRLWAMLPLSVKIKIIVVCGAFFLFLLIVVSVFAQDDVQNLSLTNGALSSNGGTVNCSEAEIQDKLIYVGDSRTVGMKSAINNSNIEFIAEVGKGYDWFNNNALASLDTSLQNKSDAVVVLTLGVNDLHNIDNYINAYKSLISKYPNNVFYVLSVNPVDDAKAAANNYSVTNAQIEDFNNKVNSSLGSNYIDTYSSLSNIVTNDGLHYDANTYNNLHNLVVSKISSSGKVMCSSGGGNFTNQKTCALTVTGGKYYKTTYPQTSSCTVDGWYTDNSWGLEPNFIKNIESLISAGTAQGCKAHIISGHRTRSKQAYFYNCYITKSCNNGNLAAKPGYGNHEYGIAADLRYEPDIPKCVSFYHSNAASYGLAYTVPSEDWHIEPINIVYGNP